MTEAMTTIAAAPLVPWPLIALLSIAAAAVVGLALKRRARGTWWRALGFAAALGALINPALVEESRELLPDVAVVVIDDSASQSIGTRHDQAAAAADALATRLAAIPNLETRIVTFDAAANAAGTTPGSGTRLFELLGRTLVDVPRQRLAGVGVGQPYNLGSWLREIGLPADAFRAWAEVDFAAELGRAIALPVFSENDGNAAAIAELFYGCGRQHDNFVYLFLGPVIGGGIAVVVATSGEATEDSDSPCFSPLLAVIRANPPAKAATAAVVAIASLGEGNHGNRGDRFVASATREAKRA